VNPTDAPAAGNQTPGAAYRGRLAPSPTGFLHLGHARTFWVAQQRAKEYGGTLILRNDDLDRARCKPEFVAAMIEDLRWFGLEWQEGPDPPGRAALGPYTQSERLELHRAALEKLRAGGFIYPCTCSRKDIQRAASAPNAEDEEPIYPGTCRPKGRSGAGVPPVRVNLDQKLESDGRDARATKFSWRFRVPDGEAISFTDRHCGPQTFVAGNDFGDFVVWSSRDANEGPSYQLACVVDDAAMRITEVVRGADLLVSTARQLLLYRALQLTPPGFFHCPLVLDETGQRLAKRHDALSLRAWRGQGKTPAELRQDWGQ